jgi:predicted nucleotidyltransferase
MKNSYHISIEKLRIEGFKELFDALDRTFNTYGVDYYVVGAFARDVWFTIHEIKERRSTRDIDIAILIATEEQFMNLKSHLITHEEFTEIGSSRFTLLHQSRIQIDLLPFGAVEAVDRTVKFKGIDWTTISTQGLEEVYRASQSIEIRQGNTFKVSTLPGLIILKLIAWQDY